MEKLDDLIILLIIVFHLSVNPIAASYVLQFLYSLGHKLSDLNLEKRIPVPLFSEHSNHFMRKENAISDVPLLNECILVTRNKIISGGNLESLK